MDARLFLSRIFHRFLKPPLSLVRLLIVLSSILAFGVVSYDLVTDRQRTEQAALDAARQQALVQSRAAAEMVQATLDRFDFALQTARDAAVAGPRAMTFQEELIARTLPSDLALQQFRIGADGYLEYSSLGPAPRNYLGDRDYFKELAADQADRLVVSPPVLGRLTKKWSIQLARAIRRDGRFDRVAPAGGRFDGRVRGDDARGFDARRYDNRYGGNWNRDWRRDDRYDWNRYRSYNRQAYRLPRYYVRVSLGRAGIGFGIGASLSSLLWAQSYWLDDPYAYRLPPAWGPFRWVRYYDDASARFGRQDYAGTIIQARNAIQQAPRMLAALVSGKRWPLDRWQRLFVAHPLLRIVGRSLIWRAPMLNARCSVPAWAWH